jgi:hypothetical protein
MTSKQNAGGINGRRMTLFVVGSLLFVLLVSGYCLWLYSRIEKSRDEATVAWRAVASELSQRYRAAEKLVARGVDSGVIDIAMAEKFRLSLDAFATTTQVDHQISAAEELEIQLTQIRPILAGGAEPAELEAEWDRKMERTSGLLAAIKDYAAIVQNQHDLRSSLGGRLLLFFIKLTGPREFQVVSVLPNSRIL